MVSKDEQRNGKGMKDKVILHPSLDIPVNLAPETEEFVRNGHVRAKLWYRLGKLEVREHNITKLCDVKALADWLNKFYDEAIKSI